MGAAKMHASDSPDGIAGFSVLDLTKTLALNPDRIIVEVADDLPDLGGRLFEHGAVIGAGHRSFLLVADTGMVGRRATKTHPISDGTAGLRGGRNRLKFAAKPPFSGMNL
jgi:hypothetical protein